MEPSVNQPNYQPPQQPMNQGQQPYQQAPQKSSDPLGIASIILAFIAPLFGLILGLIGASKAKKEGRSPMLSRIGWIVSLVTILFTLLLAAIFLAVPIMQRNQRETLRRTEMALIKSELEDFYSLNRHYPASLDELDVVFTLNTGGGTAAYSYIPQPADCVRCESYVLETKQDFIGDDTPLELESDNQ